MSKFNYSFFSKSWTFIAILY